jgi:hypothetical protein
MMHSSPKLWLILCLTSLLLGTVPLHAQEAPPSPKKGGLEVSLLAVELLKGAEDVVIRTGETSSDLIELPTHGTSDPIQLSARSLIIAAPPEEDSPGRALGKITLPAEGKKFLLLLVPVPSKNSYFCQAVRQDDPGFKPGDVCFFNVSNSLVGGTLGDKDFVSKPGTPLLVAPPKKGDLPYYQVKFYFKTDQETRAFTDTRWPFSERHRSYVFFYTKQKSGRISYRAVDDPVPVKE